MVTVADVLAVHALGLVDITVSDPTAEVSWVTTSELPDPTPFLEGGELVMTTGLATTGWRARDWQRYVERLRTAGVVCLAFGTGLTRTRIPAGLVTACGEVGLNLVEVPRATTFVAISRVVTRLLEESESVAARESLLMQRELTQAALHADGRLALVSRLAGLTQGSACLLAPDGRLLVEPVGPGDDVDTELARGELTRLRRHGLRGAASVASTGTVLAVHPIGLHARPRAYLALATTGRPSPGQRSAVTTAVALLSLASERDHEQQSAERRLRRQALELLVEGEPRAAGLVLGAIDERLTLPAEAHWLRARGSEDVRDDLHDLLDAGGLLAGTVGEELWALVPAGAALERLERLVLDQPPGDLRVGLGELVPMAAIRRSHESSALAVAEATEATPVIWWQRIVSEGVLALVDPARASAYAASFLAVLDEPAGQELRATLAAFVRHHGSRAGVADELGVHRNTVRHRLDQIEAALGRSLDDPLTRVNAWLALHADRSPAAVTRGYGR